MQDRCTYEYAIVRIVPKVEREEFVNVGVLVFSKRKKFIGIKYHVDTTKLKALAPELDLELYQQYLTAWESICSGTTAGGKIAQMETSDRFRWLTAAKSSTLQCPKTHTGLCHQPEKTLEELFDKYVM